MVLVLFQLGTEVIYSIDTGWTILELCANIMVWFIVAVLFIPFLLDFGLMEFIGTLISGTAGLVIATYTPIFEWLGIAHWICSRYFCRIIQAAADAFGCNLLGRTGAALYVGRIYFAGESAGRGKAGTAGGDICNGAGIYGNFVHGTVWAVLIPCAKRRCGIDSWGTAPGAGWKMHGGVGGVWK